MRSIQRLRLTAGFSFLPLLEKAAVSIWCPTVRVTNKSTDQEPEGQLSPPGHPTSASISGWTPSRAPPRLHSHATKRPRPSGSPSQKSGSGKPSRAAESNRQSPWSCPETAIDEYPACPSNALGIKHIGASMKRTLVVGFPTLFIGVT